MQWESISHILTKTAEKSPEKTAVLSDDFFVDYSSLDDGVDFLAEAIADAGVSPFDRVGVYIRSGYEFLVTVLALSRLDAVPALLDVLDDPEAGGRIPAEAGLDFIITHGADAALAEEVFLDDGEPCAVPGAPDFALVFREPSVADAPSDAGIIFITAEDRKPVFVSHEAMLESVEEIAGSLRLSAWDTVAVTESMTSRESFSLGLGTLLVGGSLSFGRAPHHVDASRTYMAGPRPVTVLDAARRRRRRPLGTFSVDVSSRPRMRAIVGGGGQLVPDSGGHRFGTVSHSVCPHLADVMAENPIYALDLGVTTPLLDRLD